MQVAALEQERDAAAEKAAVLLSDMDELWLVVRPALHKSYMYILQGDGPYINSCHIDE